MKPEIAFDQITPMLPGWLTQQRWMSKSEEALRSARIVTRDVLAQDMPMLLWAIIETGDNAHYQVLVGLREADIMDDILSPYPNASIGTVDDNGVTLHAYDALADPYFSRMLLKMVSNGKVEGTSVRIPETEQSNTSLIYDDKVIMKVIRRMYEGTNPDIDVTAALAKAGYPHVAPVLAVWERGDWDLAVCQAFLADGTEGWALALSSVDDALKKRYEGGSGDFSDEAFRIGEMTGRLHVAMAQCFPVEEVPIKELILSLESGSKDLNSAKQRGLQHILDTLRAYNIDELGKAVRVHGDYHLGQTLRSRTGWHMFDFEGEPTRPLEERMRATSPFKDVTGMARSFHYASAVGLRGVPAGQQNAEIANTWEVTSREAFLEGYFATDGVNDLLPSTEGARTALMAAYEAEKAIYELSYERAFRPDWVGIPESALDRILALDSGGQS